MLKFKRTVTKASLATLGAVYLTTFSYLDLNIFLKSYVVIIPVQLLALVYGIHLIYIQKTKSQR